MAKVLAFLGFYQDWSGDLTSESSCQPINVAKIPEYTANFAWGDDDYRSLFITASTSLYRLRVKVPGRPAF